MTTIQKIILAVLFLMVIGVYAIAYSIVSRRDLDAAIAVRRATIEVELTLTAEAERGRQNTGDDSPSQS